MKRKAGFFIILGSVGGVCALTGLCLLGMAISYNNRHIGSQSVFTPVGMMLTVAGAVIIVLASSLYKKEQNQEAKKQ